MKHNIGRRQIGMGGKKQKYDESNTLHECPLCRGTGESQSGIGSCSMCRGKGKIDNRPEPDDYEDERSRR